MLIEQAFYSVPEFLVGTGFSKFDAEETLVMAYSMAVLQEMNGRNVNNPIAQIRGEVRYPASHTRNADVHIDYSKVGILSSVFEDYGVRRNNWLEAKYFRTTPSGNTGGKQTLTYALLRDLLRVIFLVPEPLAVGVTAGAMPTIAAPAAPMLTPTAVPVSGVTPAPTGAPGPAVAPAGRGAVTAPVQSTATRYLLHVYADDPTKYVVVRRNADNVSGIPRKDRGWIKRMWAAGPHNLDDFEFDKEPAMFDTEIGAGFRSLDLKVRLANLVAVPASGDGEHMYLTRVVSFEASLQGHTIAMSDRGVLAEGALGDWAWFATFTDQKLAK